MPTDAINYGSHTAVDATAINYGDHTPVDSVPAPEPTADHPWLSAAGRAAGALMAGASNVSEGLKGAYKTALGHVFEAAAPLERMAGMEQRVNRPEVQAGMALTNPSQKVGGALETAAEYMIPSGATGAIGKGVETAVQGMKYAPAARIAANAVLSGVSAAGVRGAQTGGDPQEMKRAGLTAGAVSGATSAIGEAGSAIAGRLKDSAQRQYSLVLGPTTAENKLITEKQAAPGLIQRGVTAMTRKGLQEKIAASVDDFGQQIGNAIDALPADAAIPQDRVLKAIDNAASKQFYIQSPNGPTPISPDADAGLKTIEKLKLLVRSGATRDAQGNDNVDSRFLRELRQGWDGLVATGKGFTTNDLVNNSKLAAYRSAAGAIREEFAAQYPDIAAINKQYSFWKNAQKVIDATMSRTQSQSKPMGEQIVRGAAAGAGLLTGGPAKAVIDAKAASYLMQAMRSAAWNTTSAVVKDNLAQALLAGNMDGVSQIAGAIAAGANGAMSPPPSPPQRPVMNPQQ